MADAPMKIVYLNPTGQLGGAEISLLDILASIRKAEPDWLLSLIVAAEGPLVSRAKAYGIPTMVVPFPRRFAQLGDAGAGGSAGHQISRLAFVHRLFSAAPAVVTYVRRLRRVLREIAPDVLHTNGFKMHILALWSRPQ